MYNYQAPMTNMPVYQDRIYPPMQQAPAGVPGRIVNDFSEITMQDIPMNCQPAFFIKSDLSEIQMRKWTDDCRVITQSFKPETLSEGKHEDPFEGIMKRFDSLEEQIGKLQPSRRKVNGDE